jgi:hydroxyethylthiazole kinase-like uncharacterized protein yjeF
VSTAHTVEQIRKAERNLMAELPNGALMRRAAAGLAAATSALLPGLYGARVGVLAGSGDNGGDALYAAARLARRGARVEVEVVGDHVHEAALASLRTAGGRVVDALGWADLVLDGIVGIGGRPGLRDHAADAVARVAGTDATIVAVDVPSGIGVDDGVLDGPHVEADVTVTFGTHKIGLLVDPAASAAGVVELVDIGLGSHLGAPAIELLQEADVASLLPMPSGSTQKYARGVLAIYAGSDEYPGAGLLATLGAVRSGWAGMVRYCGAFRDIVHARLPEVVGEGRVQACVVGPGGGVSAGEQLGEALAHQVPLVIDADALEHVDRWVPPNAILTPHAGELARMLQVDRSVVEASPLQYLRAAVDRYQCVVLLKGARTLIASPDQAVTANATGVPWLATAGSGDVLSGLIGSLLAAGLDPYDAARVGAWLHGRAGTIASGAGAHPVSAEDIAGALPQAAASCLGSA